MGVHVVSKLDNRQHASFNLEKDAQRELSESSVRIRTQLISLTSNNLTYALMGGFLRWWDAYPVSEDYPAPYNDPSAWGIVPAWGYATVEETAIPELPKGTLLYGFWPTTSTPTDLKLKRGSPEGHWIEASDHRQQLMPLYNRYTVTPTSTPISALTTAPNPLSASAQDELDRMAWTALFIGGSAGYILSEHVFSSDPSQPPIHPLGNQARLQWTLSDGDLSSAVVVNLAASTNTARVFSYYLSRKPDASAPLGLLQVTSGVSRIAEAGRNLASVPLKAVRYQDITSDETADWLASRKAEKIVIVDFGGRANALEDTLSLIKSHAELQSCKVVIVNVGNEQKVYSMEEIIAGREATEKLGKVQYNTSGVQDTILESIDPEAYFATKGAQWERWLDERHLSVPGKQIVFGRGVSGADGVEGGWDRLCDGQVGADEGLVYKIQA